PAHGGRGRAVGERQAGEGGRLEGAAGAPRPRPAARGAPTRRVVPRGGPTPRGEGAVRRVAALAGRGRGEREGAGVGPAAGQAGRGRGWAEGRRGVSENGGGVCAVSREVPRRGAGAVTAPAPVA